MDLHPTEMEAGKGEEEAKNSVPQIWFFKKRLSFAESSVTL